MPNHPSGSRNKASLKTDSAELEVLLSNNPFDIKNLYALASIKVKLHQFDVALKLYQNILKINPGQANVYFNCGIVYGHLRQFNHAISSYEQAIFHKPDHYKAYNNLGKLLKDQKRLQEALRCYDAALKINPRYPEAYNNKGNLLVTQKRRHEAMACFEAAIRIKPDFAEAYNNLGKVLKDLNQFDAALANYETAVALQPDYANAQLNRALLYLLQGNFEQGWRLYEWRWQTRRSSRQNAFKQAVWLGQRSITNKKLLIWAEQGFGDFIQFCRYLPTLTKMGATLSLRISQPLIALLHSLPCHFESITSEDEPLPEFDYHCPVMSLPLALGTTAVSKIPHSTPYLAATSDRKHFWKKRLGKTDKMRIGLAWSGSRTHNNDLNRSFPLSMMSSLLDLPIEFHAIQKDIRPDDDKFLQNQPNLFSHSDELNDFADTAALIENMDLVISVDTSVAHLTGALNKTVWILLAYIPDHRWLMKRHDSPWYPSAKLFRQPEHDDWPSVICQVVNELKQKMPTLPQH